MCPTCSTTHSRVAPDSINLTIAVSRSLLGGKYLTPTNSQYFLKNESLNEATVLYRLLFFDFMAKNLNSLVSTVPLLLTTWHSSLPLPSANSISVSVALIAK